MNRALAVAVIFLAALVANAQGLSPKDAFARLKKLAGNWEMSNPDGSSAKVNFKVSGGGSSLIETQFPGEPHEMVSVYHMDGKNLMMTHYCAAGNQPTMIYKPGKDSKVLFFDFLRGSNMKPKDMHIHTAKFNLLHPDHFQSHWTGYVNAKKGPTTTFDLKRVAASLD